MMGCNLLFELQLTDPCLSFNIVIPHDLWNGNDGF